MGLLPGDRKLLLLSFGVFAIPVDIVYHFSSDFYFILLLGVCRHCLAGPW